MTAASIYEFSNAVRKSFDYNWPREVFDAIGVDDGSDEEPYDEEEGDGDHLGTQPEPPTPSPPPHDVLVYIGTALAFDAARRFVQANLAESDLSPERVVESLAISRATIYRLFQHEGGLHAYIRHLRLRAAADSFDSLEFPSRRSPFLSASRARQISRGRFGGLLIARHKRFGRTRTGFPVGNFDAVCRSGGQAGHTSARTQ